MYTSSFLGRSPSRFPNLLQPLRASGGFTTRFSSQNLTNGSLSSVLLSLPLSTVFGRPVTTTFSLRLAVSCKHTVYLNLHGACLCSQNSLGSIQYVVLTILNTVRWLLSANSIYNSCSLLETFLFVIQPWDRCVHYIYQPFSAVLLSADCNPA